MANMLDDGAAWLLGQLKQSAGRTVSYTPIGETPITGLTAIRAVEQMRTFDAQGAPTQVSLTSFVIGSADIDGVTPTRGDVITETAANGDVVRWEVAPPPGRTVWKYADASRAMVRIYVVEVE